MNNTIVVSAATQKPSSAGVVSELTKPDTKNYAHISAIVHTILIKEKLGQQMWNVAATSKGFHSVLERNWSIDNRDLI